jgi:hypothetical protein
MRKRMLILTITLAAAAMIALFSSPASAAVSGPCSNCHTMHNSQSPWPDQWGLQDEGPRGALVADTCLGCHTTDGSDPFDENKYPYVKSSLLDGFDDDNCIAGGFFPHNDDDGLDNEGRAHSMGSTETPPGYNAGDGGPQSDWYMGVKRGLACAGDSGCHGKHDIENPMGAIKGGHHAPEADVYRILYIDYQGVRSVGADDYEEELIKNVTPGTTGTSTYDHNVYSADADAEETISELCANCHGDFHGDDDTSVNDDGKSPFKRHPSDVSLPDDWELGTVALVSDNYDDRDRKYNPLGFPDADEGGDPRATCLSCHRAHGTENLDILRFDYDKQLAGQEEASQVKYGCLGCHNEQR